MPDIGPVPSAYVSDGEIIAWLEQKSNDQYGRLGSMMFTSNERSGLMQQLTSLQGDIDAGKPADQVLSAMQAIQAQYEGTDLGPEVDQLLSPMEATLSSPTPSAVVAIAKSALQNVPLMSPLPSNSADSDQGASDKALKDNKDDFSTKIKGEVDKLGRIDSLDLINIQQVVADARQTDELGSNILSSRDQTSNAILSNVRG